MCKEKQNKAKIRVLMRYKFKNKGKPLKSEKQGSRNHKEIENFRMKCCCFCLEIISGYSGFARHFKLLS